MSNAASFEDVQYGFKEAASRVAIVTCHQCNESVLSKRGKYLSTDLVTETLVEHRHQPGSLSWRAYEDETGESMTKHVIAQRVAAIRRRELKRGK